MTMKRVLIGLALVVLSACPSQAQDCQTLSQVRRANPDAHLYYRLEGRRAGGRKCWYAPAREVRRERAIATGRRAVEAPDYTPPPRTIFDDIFAFFTPRPIEAVEEEEEVKKAPAKKVRVARTERKSERKSERRADPKIVDEKIKDLCGPFIGMGWCNEDFQTLQRDQRRRGQ
jgi:hypothetical protein